MHIDGGGLTVTIQWLTIDGNRNGTNPCVTNFYDPIADLDLSSAGVATVQHVNFISATHNSLFLSTLTSGQASTVAYSNFGQGFSQQGISRTGPQTASRASAIVFNSGDNTGAWYNNIAYAGSSAIMEYGGTGGGGAFRYIIGNNINSNTYEQPDGVPGGQIYIQGGNVSYTSVADNVINGDYWDTSYAQQSNPPSPHYTLCTPGDRGGFTHTYPYGIEASASGDRYFNNSIIQNNGFGIILRPWNNGDTLNGVTISGYDPFCPSYCTYVPQYISNNAGCWTSFCFSPPTWSPAIGVAGINVNNSAGNITGNGYVTNFVLDHVRSTNNYRFGISLDHVSGTGYEDSAQSPATSYPYACITGNGTNVNSGTSGNSLMNSTYTNICP